MYFVMFSDRVCIDHDILSGCAPLDDKGMLKQTLLWIYNNKNIGRR